MCWAVECLVMLVGGFGFAFFNSIHTHGGSIVSA